MSAFEVVLTDTAFEVAGVSASIEMDAGTLIVVGGGGGGGGVTGPSSSINGRPAVWVGTGGDELGVGAALGTAAAAAVGDFATAAQGELADTAMQPGDGAGGALSGTYPSPGLNTEAVQDLIAGFLAAGQGVELTYDDDGGTLTIAVSALAITSSTVVASEAAMLALIAQEGDVAIRSDTNTNWILGSGPSTVLGSWRQLLTPTDAVLSVAGKTGVVTLAIADIGSLQSALDAKQAASAELSALAAQSSTSYGRSFLTLADRAAFLLALALTSSDIPNLDAAKITTGTIATARLGACTATTKTVLRGNSKWGISGPLLIRKAKATGDFYGLPRGGITGTYSFAPDYLRAIPLLAWHEGLYDKFALYTANTVGGKAWFGIYDDDGVGGLPSSRVVDVGEVLTSGAAGDRLGTIAFDHDPSLGRFLVCNFNVATVAAHMSADAAASIGWGLTGGTALGVPYIFAASTSSYAYANGMPATLPTMYFIASSSPFMMLRSA